MPENPIANGHITAEELACVIEEARQRSEPIGASSDLHPHFSSCVDCREKFDEIWALESSLQSLRETEIAPPSGSVSADCPESNLWREIVEGNTPHEQTLTAIKHASECHHCGSRLQQALAEMGSLHGEITEIERRQISDLASSRADWQQNLARRIVQQSAARRSGESSWRSWLSIKGFTIPRLAFGAVPLIALIAAGTWFLNVRHQPATAEALLARAYSQQRTLELRIAGAAYAPLRISRGPAASFTSRSPALLKAEALIAGQLASGPSNSAWLHAQAQADLLEGRYDAAVEALHAALESDPHSSSLLVDLATAYSQRAQQEDRHEDFGAAYEYLSQALQSSPNDAVALFNRAIVAEHQYLYHQALDDWDHYLRLDPSSQWAEEARNRADAVRQKLSQRRGQAAPLLSPGEIVARLNDSSTEELVNSRIEEYLQQAVTSWLPQAFPEHSPTPTVGAKSNAGRALFFLADLTARKHNDRWLADLLRGSSSNNFAAAVAALVRSAAADSIGDYSSSEQHAEVARRLFLRSGNTAGVLRSEFERTFAEQLNRKSAQCRQHAAAALAKANDYSYTWLQIQLGLENAVCSGLMSDFGENARIAEQARALAEQDEYAVVYLRAVGFMAGVKSETGDASGSWKLIDEGLQKFWSGSYPAMRGYNFYTEAARSAEIENRPNLRLAAWREGLPLADGTSELLLRAKAHDWTARAAAAAGNQELAAAEFGKAAEFYARAPQNQDDHSAALEAQIHLAEIESRQGHFDAAVGRLTSIQDQVRSVSNNYIAQLFYSTLGELQLADHHPAEAEASLQPALALTEQSLATIGSESSRVNSARLAAPEYLALVEAELVQNRPQESLAAFEWYMGIGQRTEANSFSSSLDNPISVVMTDPSRLSLRMHSLATETVLAYAALPDGLAIWGFDDRGVNSKWIPQSMENLRELADRMHELSSNPKSNRAAVTGASRALYMALIAPVESWLVPGRTLVIEADGWLSRVPYEALLDRDGRYLIERAAIVHSLGQDSDANLSQAGEISSALPSLIVGSTASPQADELLPLPDVAPEVDAVASRFHSPHILKAGDATLSAVEDELPAVSVFHFAGHSLATPDHTGLLLASLQKVLSEKDESGDSPSAALLDADRLRTLEMRNLRLAVLSSCGGDSGNVGSEGFNTMAEAFLRSGVPHVVAGRWTVDSEEARVFVADFYHYALSGEPVSQAVRHAALAMLASPATSHPYYWSAFSAYGRP